MDVKEFLERLDNQGVSFETFLAVIRHRHREKPCQLIRESTCFYEAIDRGMTWSHTPQGHQFWEAVADEARNPAELDEGISDDTGRPEGGLIYTLAGGAYEIPD